MKNFEFLDTDDLFDDEIYLRLKNLLPEDEEAGYPPTYIFRIIDTKTDDIMGEIALRIGGGRNIYYAGNIGYRVLEEFRGNNYAYKACKIAFKQAKKHNMKELIITCSPENIPSKRTCEKLGGYFKEIVDVPEDTEFFERGEFKKCIFVYEL